MFLIIFGKCNKLDGVFHAHMASRANRYPRRFTVSRRYCARRNRCLPAGVPNRLLNIRYLNCRDLRLLDRNQVRLGLGQVFLCSRPGVRTTRVEGPLPQLPMSFTECRQGAITQPCEVIRLVVENRGALPSFSGAVPFLPTMKS